MSLEVFTHYFGLHYCAGSTQPLNEMSTRNISWGVSGRFLGLTILSPSFANCLEIWEPRYTRENRAKKAEMTLGESKNEVACNIERI